MPRFLSLLLLAGAACPLALARDVQYLTNSIGMKFAIIPAGRFTMGSPETEKGRNDDEPQHEVRFARPFYLGVYEVTQGQYANVMGDNPSWFSKAGGGKQRVGQRNADAYPVDNVTWTDAVGFCRKLPTEAEWEYACRAGTNSVFHYGDDLDAYKANFCGLIYAAYGSAGAGPFLRATTAVGQYSPNEFGLYDMHGNVQEWCQDWYAADAYMTGDKEDPQGPKAGAERVVRGGGWPHSGKSVRSAVRGKLAPEEKNYSTGFRVVLMK
jgi:formylglycine-generating enzyme